MYDRVYDLLQVVSVIPNSDLSIQLTLILTLIDHYPHAGTVRFEGTELTSRFNQTPGLIELPELEEAPNSDPNPNSLV